MRIFRPLDIDLVGRGTSAFTSMFGRAETESCALSIVRGMQLRRNTWAQYLSWGELVNLLAPATTSFDERVFRSVSNGGRSREWYLDASETDWFRRSPNDIGSMANCGFTLMPETVKKLMVLANV